jgi:hypothetical protein
MLRFMPSWSPSTPPPEKQATPAGSGQATAIERARRLLDQILTGRPRETKPPRAKK